ncbi:S-adenosyl-L-methionine-dependent methyltransferase [Calocera viscosa TUFC12733]|uniref:S-adenosyl-L-methionine-dependent methyltransferase n=1 Tax=Calocera viscosa (strain TUFC12733) TaxID=1330018 RepID=A0A167KY11_CALVF|nr:S-adenosyl-L-methionine-dependent methyltransferase [Calocera viscosa TUFC12733]
MSHQEAYHGHSVHAHPHASSSSPHIHPHQHIVPAHSHAEANRAHYDTNAASYDRMEIANELAAWSAGAMRRVWTFDEETTECLDYACGTGLVSRQLAPFCKTILGVDISQGMVDYYNERVSNQGISPLEMRAVRAELTGSPGELDGKKFDVVVCSQAYHHISDIRGTTKALAGLLRPGGALLVVDLLRSEQALFMHTGKAPPEHVRHTVAHKGGLEEGEVRECFDFAGLGEWAFDVAYERKVEGRVLKLFIAKGVKALDAAT